MFSRKYDRRQAPWKMSRLPRFSCPPFGTAEASVLGLLERSQWAKNGKKRLAMEEFFEEEAGEAGGGWAEDGRGLQGEFWEDGERDTLGWGKNYRHRSGRPGAMLAAR